MKTLFAYLMAVGLMVSMTPASQAGGDTPKNADVEVSDETERMTNATTTLKEIVGIPEDGIPQSMLDNAAAIVVIPGLVKASFIVGGKRGEGVMSVRNVTGWTHPTFVNLTGGSIGWQAGVSSTDLVLVFMNEKTVKELLNGEFTLGADAAVAVGPVGRVASAGTNLELKAEIYSYSRSSGLFAGISVDGSQLDVDNDANVRYYGAGRNASDVLYGASAKAPQSADEFKLTLNKLTHRSL
jgi:lipid-binding SYLF domain-containing protein